MISCAMEVHLLTYLFTYLLTTVIGGTSSEAFKLTTYYCTPCTSSAWIWYRLYIHRLQTMPQTTWSDLYTEFYKLCSAIVPTKFSTHGRLVDVKMTFSGGRKLSMSNIISSSTLLCVTLGDMLASADDDTCTSRCEQQWNVAYVRVLLTCRRRTWLASI